MISLFSNVFGRKTEKEHKVMITKEKNKGNIPLDGKLLNRYLTVRAIFDDAENILKCKDKIIKLFDIEYIRNIDLNNLRISNAKTLANDIFNKYHDKNYFFNNNSKIIVSKSGINESIEKIYNNRIQRDYMIEHLIVFSKLGEVIENAKLVNQIYERKNRENTLFWNYYIISIYINTKLFIIEFEVRSMHDGENHYRLQRLELEQIKTSGALQKH